MTRLAELSDTDLAMAAMWLLTLIAAIVVLVRILAFLAHEFRADLRKYREDAHRRRTEAARTSCGIVLSRCSRTGCS